MAASGDERTHHRSPRDRDYRPKHSSAHARRLPQLDLLDAMQREALRVGARLGWYGAQGKCGWLGGLQRGEEDEGSVQDEGGREGQGACVKGDV